MRTILSFVTAGGLIFLCSSNALIAPVNGSRQSTIFSRSSLPGLKHTDTLSTTALALQQQRNKPFQKTKALAAAAEGIPESKWRRRIQSFIPEPQERKKLIPLAIMFFFIIFNYTILRDTKDVLVRIPNFHRLLQSLSVSHSQVLSFVLVTPQLVTAPKSGAEGVSYACATVQWYSSSRMVLFL